MIDREALEEFDRELGRVVDRLRSMPITRIGAAVEPSRTTALALLELSAALGDPAPGPLPRVEPIALGDQMAVLGHDLRHVALERDDGRPIAEATGVLVRLRRQLA